MKANLVKSNFTIAPNGSTERDMTTEHRREYYKKRVDWFEPGEITADMQLLDDDPSKHHDLDWSKSDPRHSRNYSDRDPAQSQDGSARSREKSMQISGHSIRKSNISLGVVPSDFQTTASTSFKPSTNQEDLRYKLDMSKIRNSSIPMRDQDHKNAYQSTAASEFTKKELADTRGAPHREGGSQKTNFSLGNHKTDYRTVSTLKAPEAGVSYSHPNRGAAANRKASWHTGSEKNTWETEAGQSTKFTQQPKSLLEAKPNFIELDKQRSRAKQGPPPQVHNPGHVSSVYIGVPNGKGDWATEAAKNFTSKNASAEEAARDRAQVAEMKDKVRRSNLKLTDHSATAYESTSKAQLFDPSRDGGAAYGSRTVLDKASLNKTNFHMGSVPTDYETTAGGNPEARAEQLRQAVKEHHKQASRTGQSQNANVKTNVRFAAPGADAKHWQTNQVSDFAAPPPEAYKAKDVPKDDEWIHLQAVERAQRDHDTDTFAKPDMSEFWKDHRPKPVDADLRSAHFSLGRDAVEYTSQSQQQFQKLDESHYRGAGAVKVPALRASNFTLGHEQTVWQSTTQAAHHDEDDDE